MPIEVMVANYRVFLKSLDVFIAISITIIMIMRLGTGFFIFFLDSRDAQVYAWERRIQGCRSSCRARALITVSSTRAGAWPRVARPKLE